MSSSPERTWANRSMPNPNANPEYSSGSTPTAANTLGSTMPQPPSSIQPEPLQVRQPEPPQMGQVTSNSADGSVNGKNDGRSRLCIPGPKKALVKASIVPARSPKVMPRSTASPSI